ncbi:porin [Reyranella sp. CPCC 100927]|uniref:porin n=1 Tax=Reyranella sp. CPCC 100927 TaxID=2599616 RepID=UPI0011B6276B|nr:porin [Reyranella sp. CPCC 100927]TWT11638.1 porin [Reyranella sp. CPCC 100927]
MKKTLLGTTALVAGGLLAAPAMAADPIKLELRGYFQAMIILGQTGRDVSPAGIGQGYRSANFKYEGEIWFTGTTKLDNGTSIGLRLELEAWSQGGGATSSNDQFDEEYLFAFGDWGRIEFGGTDSASFKMVYSSPSALIGWGFNDHNFWQRGDNTAASNQAGRGFMILGTAAAQNVGFSGDATKLTYFTPRIAGLQVGFSYTPAFSATAGAATCAFRQGGANFNSCPNNNNQWNNGLDISANYLNKFGDVSVALYGAYATAAFDRGPVGAGGAAAPGIFGRYKTWAVGGQVGVGGFTLGGGLGRDNMGLKGANGVRWYTASLMYETGAWQVSAGWWGGRNPDRNRTPNSQNVPGKDKLDYFELGTNYTLSPGIKLTGGVFYQMGSGQSKSEKADTWAVVLGTALTF